ncbi:MAG TPA: hypothetical protein EYQ57_04095 [Methylococcaceae bacterium]|nr:hypothetical protein [Methylococcaceae bacterium]
MKQHHANKQQGATMMLTLVFMIGMLGIIGLAIDTGHILVNKTRLQNALDATALSAAITLNGPTNNSVAESINAGIATFNLFKNSQGNNELAGVTLTAANFLFSDNVSQFLSGVGGTPNFVRVSTNALQVNNFFIQVFTGTASENVGAISTAGPMGQNCNLVPLVICADIDPVTGDIDKDCSDNDGDGIRECYGYNMHEESELHTKFCAPNDTSCQATALEAGNFTLLRWEGNAGKNDIRNSLSGTVNSCSVGVQLETDPGNAVGPVGQGINDRFYHDTVTDIYDHISNPTAATPGYIDYLASQATALEGDGLIKNNRIVAAPVGDCNGIQQGNTTFDFATDGSGNMAAMCILIRRPVRTTGANKDSDYLKNSIYIEMLELCPVLGKTDPNNPVIYGPLKIVLFKSENSKDS